MPTYIFRGRDASGKLQTGKRTSQSADTLSSQLFKEGITPIAITATEQTKDYIDKLKEFLEGSAIPTDQLSMFARQMYTLCKAGVPITGALKQFSANTRNNRFSNVIASIVENLEAGQDLASSMQKYPNIFSQLMVSMVRVGQNSGHLDEAFLHLHEYLEIESGAVKRVKAALRYPAFVFVTIIVAIVLVNIFVIPTFSSVFANAKVKLPMISQLLINISQLFVHYWVYMLVVSIAGIVALTRYLKSPKGHLFWNKWQLKLPVIGNIFRRVIMLRFSQSFAITSAAGIPMTEGLGLVARAIDNDYAKQEILSMQDAIARGSTLTKAAANTDLFTPMELQIFSVSEETGDLSSMLVQLGNYYASEVDYDLKRLNDFIEPVLIIFLSVVILMLALAVYLPIWHMVKLVHK